MPLKVENRKTSSYSIGNKNAKGVDCVVNINNSIHEEEQYTTENQTYKEGQKVRNYKEETSLEYPNIVMHTTSMETHIAKLLKSMTVDGTYTEVEGYTLYVEMGGSYAKVGLLQKERLESVMASVFDKFTRVVNLDTSTAIEGELIHALCPPKMY